MVAMCEIYKKIWQGIIRTATLYRYKKIQILFLCLVLVIADGLFQLLFFCFVTVIEVDHGWARLTHSHVTFFPLVLSPWKKAR